MPRHGSGSQPFIFRRVMIFIDGSYLRIGLNEEGLNEVHQLQNYKILALRMLPKIMGRPFHGEHIRTYWYDAKYNERDGRYDSQNAFFNKLRGFENFEVKTGQIIHSAQGDRQKGVDVLLAVDMLTKAYENHYDVAVFIGGDRDFIPLIKAVKDQTGKQVYGAVFSRSCSQELKREFDKCMIIKRTLDANKIEFNQCD